MKSLLLLSILFISTFSFGQERIITARVIDNQTSSPISGVKAKHTNSSISSTSNFLGYFQIWANAGDTLTITHPSYTLSQVVIPNVEAFEITLDPKYIELKNLYLDGYPFDPAVTKLNIPEPLEDSTSIAKYDTGWQGFYLEFGNVIAKHPSFTELGKEFSYDIQFSVSKKGLIENPRQVIDDSVSSVEGDLFTSSIMSLKQWTPATFNDMPISQHFKLNISMGKEIFTIVENPATPPGGYQGFFEYVAKSINYPEQARKKGIQGKVYVQFVVDKDGSLTEVEVVKGIGSGCDEEAVSIVQAAPKWNPANQKGIAVKQRIMLPITFNLGRR